MLTNTQLLLDCLAPSAMAAFWGRCSTALDAVLVQLRKAAANASDSDMQQVCHRADSSWSTQQL